MGTFLSWPKLRKRSGKFSFPAALKYTIFVPPFSWTFRNKWLWPLRPSPAEAIAKLSALLNLFTVCPNQMYADIPRFRNLIQKFCQIFEVNIIRNGLAVTAHLVFFNHLMKLI